MVKYSRKVLDLLALSEASAKEQRRATYVKKRIDSVNHSQWQHSGLYNVATKRYPKWTPSLSPIFEAENARQLASDARFAPQSGFTKLSLMSDLTDLIINKLGIKCADDILSEIEGLILLFIAVSNSRNYTGALASVGLYVRKRFDKSLSSEIMSYLRETFEYVAQSGPFVDSKAQEDCDDPEWLIFMKDLKSNWLQCQNSSLFKQFTKVLSVVVMSGLYRVSDMTFSIKGHKVFEPDMKLLVASASDVMTAVAELVIYFSERIYLAVQTKSFRPFMVDSLETAEFEQEYVHLMNHWELYRNGNLIKVAGVEPQTFLSNLLAMSHKIETMLSKCSNYDKRILELKYREIIKVIGDFAMIRGNSAFRCAPFCIEYFGSSAVGKSTISKQTSSYLLKGAGLNDSDLNKYNYTSGKKHWDGARSDMVELTIDDHANVKSDFVEASPCDVIIKVCNNVPYSPPMADLVNKGKVYIEPELVTLTTNVENLDAGTYSNNPFSIQRRMHYVVEVKVKEEFVRTTQGKPAGIDTAKVHEFYTTDGVLNLPPFQDVWLLTVKKAVAPDMLTTTAQYSIVKDGDKLLKDITMMEWLNFAAKQFKKHREEQHIMRDSSEEKVEVEPCGVDGCTQIKGYCMEHSCLDKQLGFETIREYCRQTTDSLLQEGRDFYDTYDWLPYLPDCVVANKCVRNLFCLSNAKTLAKQYATYSKINGLICLCVLGLINHKTCGFGAILGTIVTLLLAFGCQYLLIDKVRSDYLARIDKRHVLNQIHRDWRDRLCKSVLVGSTALGSLYLIAKAYRVMSSFNKQGNLEPNNAFDIMRRDREPDVWASVVKRPLPCTQKSIEHTTDVVIAKVRKNLLYATIIGDDDKRMFGNVLFVDSNILIIPDHYFGLSNSDSLRLECRKENAHAIGGYFVTRVDKVSSYLIPNTDLRVCYSSAGGSYGNIIDYFPTGDLQNHAFRMMWRDISGEIVNAQGRATIRKVSNGVCWFKGGRYANISMRTFSGLCGATIISEGKQTCITGIHLGGREQEYDGCFGTITKNEILSAIEHIKTVPGTLKTGSEGVFDPQVMGVEMLTNDPLHPKSPVNFLPEKSQFSYHGSCVGASTSRSDVRTTPISDLVEKHTGVENIWGKPKMNPQWEPWQKAMANASVPAEPVKHEILAKSVEDYRAPLLEIARQEPWCNESPLNDHENLCGRVGCKFIDAINLGTSIGFPLTGPKRNFVIELDPTEEKPNNRVFEPFVMEYIEKCENNYKNGVRNHFVAKACVKDEILALSKGKCRIFYANPLALTWLVRKYFLPVIRMLQMNPIVSECAVGINCHGPEWDQFYKFVMTHGEDRLIGGDYGKYDQKLPAQKINAALSILIDIAKVMKYSETDIKVMETMAGDLAYAIIAYNGDLLSIQSGTHISGNSLTVILNGISGSLNLRDFFYTKYDSSVSFRDAVALMTYGDDNIGSVSPKYPEFTIKDSSKFLEAHGQIYTMPDKESELQDHLNPEDFEFLKRFSVYHPKLDCNVGALLDKSIMKSLHCYLRPKGAPLTPQEACAQNIDTALREWFNHGEEVYEKRRQQMISIAKDANIAHICTMLDETYDDRVADWKYKYAGGPAPVITECEYSVF